MTIAETDADKVRAERFGAKETETAPGASGAVPISEPPKRKRGRPPGSKNKSKDTIATESKPLPKERTAEEQKQGAQLCAFLSATLWDLVAPLAKRRSLTDDEAQKLGQALDPVLWKYAPALGNWQLEINLLVVVAVLWQGTAIEPEGEKITKYADIELGESPQ